MLIFFLKKFTLLAIRIHVRKKIYADPYCIGKKRKKHRKIHRYAKQKNARMGGALPPKSCDFGTPAGVPPDLTRGAIVAPLTPRQTASNKGFTLI
jgi:hypothetical protein